jgi:hypothetical protein
VVEAAGFGGYYWVVDQAEVSTDVMFASRPALQQVTAEILDHASRQDQRARTGCS